MGDIYKDGVDLLTSANKAKGNRGVRTFSFNDDDEEWDGYNEAEAREGSVRERNGISLSRIRCNPEGLGGMRCDIKGMFRLANKPCHVRDRGRGIKPGLIIRFNLILL